MTATLPSKAPPATPALRAEGIDKAYGHVTALRGADFECFSGEVTALIGDNGAGKSTLVKIISGVLEPDAGTITVGGNRFEPDSPMSAHAVGIETVYQDLALAPDLGPPANLFLGRELRRSGLLGRLGFLDEGAMRERTGREFRSLGVSADPARRSVRTLSGGQRQGVAVARAVAWAQRIVVMDEPTASLGVVQTRSVLELVRRVAESGLAVALISHSMPDVLAVADRIEVLRLGRRVARFTRAEASTERLVAAMTGATELAEDGRSGGADPAP